MTAHFIRTAVVAATLAASLGSAAQAQDSRTSFRPSELTTVAGRQAVFDRIRRAARYACEGGVSLAENAASKACAAQLTGQMVAGAHSPVLTAMLNGKPATEFAANGR